jgi:hypothetical protein
LWIWYGNYSNKRTHNGQTCDKEKLMHNDGTRLFHRFSLVWWGGTGWRSRHGRKYGLGRELWQEKFLKFTFSMH